MQQVTCFGAVNFSVHTIPSLDMLAKPPEVYVKLSHFFGTGTFEPTPDQYMQYFQPKPQVIG
jgi:hypothetical protein